MLNLQSSPLPDGEFHPTLDHFIGKMELDPADVQLESNAHNLPYVQVGLAPSSPSAGYVTLSASDSINDSLGANRPVTMTVPLRNSSSDYVEACINHQSAESLECDIVLADSSPGYVSLKSQEKMEWKIGQAEWTDSENLPKENA